MFKHVSASNAWQRFCLAPKFSRGVACGAKDVVPIVVILKDKHYQALRCPDQGVLPKSWLCETQSNHADLVIDLTGAGRGKRFLGSNGSDVGSIATPSVKSKASSLHSQKARQNIDTPQVRQPDTPLPSGGTKRGRASLATPSVHSDARGLATPSVYSGAAPSNSDAPGPTNVGLATPSVRSSDSQVNGHEGSRLSFPSLNDPRSISVAWDDQTIVSEEFHLEHIEPRQRTQGQIAKAKPTRRLIGKTNFCASDPCQIRPQETYLMDLPCLSVYDLRYLWRYECQQTLAYEV